MKLKGEETSVF
jgi:hypothetical protein